MLKEFNIEQIGFWSGSYDDGVTPSFLCGEMDLSIKLKVIEYLKNGHRATYFMGYARCRFECELSCRKELGCAELTDGQWYWPEGLAHYVEKHNVLLPPQFMQHLIGVDFKVLALDSDLMEFFTSHIPGKSVPKIKFLSGYDVWDNWLKEMGEDEYLKSPVIVEKYVPPELTDEEANKIIERSMRS